MLAMIFCATAAGSAEPVRIAELSESLWYADNGQQHALLGGPRLEVVVSDRLRLAGQYLFGEYQSEGDREEYVEYRLGLRLCEAPWYAEAGWASINHRTFLKRGWIWSDDIPDEEAQRNADIYGPYAAGGVRWPLGETGFALEGRGAWMPRDFGDFDDLGYDGAFIEVEGAVSYAVGKLVFRGGYRYRRFEDMPDRVANENRYDREAFRGVTGSLTVWF